MDSVPTDRYAPEVCIPVTFHNVHCSWIMSVYTRDILSRLPQIFATCTGIFGAVLKVDSGMEGLRPMATGLIERLA